MAFPQDTILPHQFTLIAWKSFSSGENYTESLIVKRNINVKVCVKSKKSFKWESLLSGFSCFSLFVADYFLLELSGDSLFYSQ